MVYHVVFFNNFFYFFYLNGRDPNRLGGTESHHRGQWCVVNYNEHTYPGFILAVEKEMKKIVHRNMVRTRSFIGQVEDAGPC